MTLTLDAHYDGKAIVLDDQYPLPPNTRLLVTVLQNDDDPEGFAERAAWAAFSKRAMCRVYGNDEPEYTIADAAK